MTTPDPLGPAPLPTWALLLLATCAAAALRVWGGYPLEPSDERNWAHIAQAVQQGVAWPISGPLHFEATQALARALALPPASALAVLGVLSVPAVLGMYVLAYRWLGFRHAGWPLLALSLSTYFWAPLLESRPQQWGQALALLCVAGAWRLLTAASTHLPQASGHPKALPWLMGSLLFAVLAWVHILSAAITLGLCASLCLCLLALHQARWQPVLLLGVCSLPGLLLLALPGGPYQTMLVAIGHSQLHINSNHLAFGGLATGATAMAALLMVRRFGKSLLSAVLRHYDASPRIGHIFLMTIAMAVLTVQAKLLPAEAWHRYEDSLLIFLIFQLGNLGFFWLLLHGLHVARNGHVANKLSSTTKVRESPISPWPNLAILLVCSGVLGGLLLLISFFVRDTNWLLRYLNYVLPIAASFVGLVLRNHLSEKALQWAALLLGISSFLVASRPIQLFGL